MWNIDNQPVFTCLNCSDAQFCYFVNFGFDFGSVVESAEVLRRSCNPHYPFGVATQLQSVATHRINRCNMTRKTWILPKSGQSLGEPVYWRVTWKTCQSFEIFPPQWTAFRRHDEPRFGQFDGRLGSNFTARRWSSGDEFEDVGRCPYLVELYCIFSNMGLIWITHTDHTAMESMTYEWMESCFSSFWVQSEGIFHIFEHIL